MSLSEVNYLLDVNVFVALLSEDHIHHQLVTAWFNTADLQWSLCTFTEAGFLRNATAPRPGQITMAEATLLLKQMAQHPGYHYLPVEPTGKPCVGRFSRGCTAPNRLLTHICSASP